MKKVVLVLVCLVGLLALGFAIASVTSAEAPQGRLVVTAAGPQGGGSAPGRATAGDTGSAAPLSASPSPTTCVIDYSYSLGGSGFVWATDVLTSGCYQCITQVDLPFPFTFYGQSYTSVGVESEGNIQFNSAYTSFPSCPFPIAQVGPAMFPFWSLFEIYWGGTGDGPCVQYYGRRCGIYTSVSGSEPNRIFNIQWVGVQMGSNHDTVNFEARLHEGTGVIDFVYGAGAMFGSYASVGLQDGGSQFVSYACDAGGPLQNVDIQWTPSGGPCASNTPTPTGTTTNTPTRTPSPTTTGTPTATATISCDLEWRVVASQSVGQDSYLFGVAAIAPNDVWAVGDGANTGVPLLEHWNGVQWAIASPTPPIGTGHRLYSAGGVASNDVWAVGYYQNGAPGANTLALHWDGTVWSWIQTPNSAGSVNELTYLSALASNDVWAVGYWDYGTYVTHTLIEHWNGSIWSIVPSPDVNGNGYLRGVTAIAPNNVWAVGNYMVSLGVTQPLILHWDGAAWSVVSGPPLTWGGSLQQVAAIGPGDMWAVGAYASTSSGYDDRTLTMHWDGTQWSVVPSPNIDTYETHLWAVAAGASNDVWAIGTYNAPQAQQSLAIHWDGTAWNVVTTPDPNPNPSPSATPTSNNLLGVAIAAPNDAWAVGSYEDGAQILTLIEHYSQTSCETPTRTPTHTATPSPTRTATATPTSSCPPSWVTIPSQNDNTDNRFTGVDAINSSDIWAVGRIGINSSGILEHWDGIQWSDVPYQPAGFADKLDAVSAISSNDAWMVGWYEGSAAGTLTEHWDGATWNVVPSPNGGGGTWSELEAVSARTASDIWAVGTTDGFGGQTAQPLILHGNGIGWAVVGSPSLNGYLTGVSALAPNDVWAVGNYIEGSSTLPLVLHWDGSIWSISSIPPFSTPSALYGVIGISATDVWAVGYASNQTLTMHWDGAAWSIVPSPNVGTGPNSLYGTDALATNDVWAVGKYTSSGAEQTLTMHWDGTGWSVVPSPSPNSGAAYMAVSMIASNQVWAVGYSHTGTTTYTLAARYGPSGQCTTSTPAATDTSAPALTPTSVSSTATPPMTTPTPPGIGTGTPTSIATPALTPTTCTIQFNDVPQGSTFYPYIHCLACLGIINGYGDGTFKPNNDVTRGQLAKIVSNSAGLSDPQTIQLFEDVSPDSTFFDYIGRLASRGYMNGYPCGGPSEPCGPGSLPYFRTNNNATRGQISKIVSNAAGFSDPPGTQFFEDVPSGSTFYDYVQRLANRGVMTGYACGGLGEPCDSNSRPYFRPGNNATRGQTSKIVSIIAACQ